MPWTAAHIQVPQLVPTADNMPPSDPNAVSFDMSLWNEILGIGKQLDILKAGQDSIIRSQAGLHAIMTCKLHEFAPLSASRPGQNELAPLVSDRPEQHDILVQSSKTEQSLVDKSGGGCEYPLEGVKQGPDPSLEESANGLEPPREGGQEHVRTIRSKEWNTSSSSKSRAVRGTLLNSINDRRKKRFIHIIELNEALDQQNREKKLKKLAMRKHGIFKWLAMISRHELETYMDSVMAVFIVLNAFFVGFSLDFDQHERAWNAWDIMDIFFTVLFATEVCLKIKMHGFRQNFCGRDRVSNVFDAGLVFLDCVQLLIGLLEQAERSSHGMPPPSLFRVIRLVRLTRLIRLLRLQMFEDLLAMVEGLYGAFLTLMWACLLLSVIIYVVSLVCRELLGRNDGEPMSEYFDSVPRSMFTIFRCSFGDCSSKTGVPIPEHVFEEHGIGFALAYCVMLFCITVGLFNVISAIFVDSTLASNDKNRTSQKYERLESEAIWASNVAVIVRSLLTTNPEYASIVEKGSWLDQMDELLAIEFKRDEVQQAVQCSKEMRHALTALDIDERDMHRLPDIIDPDHSGTINALELINGLQHLRGEPRRSDVVSVDLMIRNLQEVLDEILSKTTDVEKKTRTMKNVICNSEVMRPEVMKHRSTGKSHATTPKITTPRTNATPRTNEEYEV